MIVETGVRWADWRGEGEVVAVSDTGLDYECKCRCHPHFKNITAIEYLLMSPPDIFEGVHWNYYCKVKLDRNEGHGTAVASLIVGGQGNYRGHACEAKLVFLGIERFCDLTIERRQRLFEQTKRPVEHFHLIGIPVPFSELLKEANDAKALVHNYSINNQASSGAKDHKDIDGYLANNDEFLFVCSAGNVGFGQPVKYPGKTINGLSVGAYHTDEYGKFKPAYYSARGVVNSNSPGHVIKPDLVAPGKVWVARSRSSVPWKLNPENGECTPWEAKDLYREWDGTSFAAPAVASAAVSLRQYLRVRCGVPNPSSALLRALLINAAEYRPEMNGERFGELEADTAQGWGLLRFPPECSLDDTPRRFLCCSGEFPEGSQAAKNRKKILTIRTSAPQNGRDTSTLKVTLAWLEVTVTANNSSEITIGPMNVFLSSGTREFAQSQSLYGTIRAIHIPDPEPGEYEVSVENPGTRRKFALVVSGCIQQDDVIVHSLY